MKTLLSTEDCGRFGRIWNWGGVIEKGAHPQPDHLLEDLNLQRQSLVEPAQRMKVPLDRLEDFLFALAPVSGQQRFLGRIRHNRRHRELHFFGALPGGQQHLLL